MVGIGIAELLVILAIIGMGIAGLAVLYLVVRLAVRAGSQDQNKRE